MRTPLLVLAVFACALVGCAAGSAAPELGTLDEVATKPPVTYGAGTPPPAVAHEAPPFGAAPHDFLHTRGGAIVDALGRPVRLTGVSWFGMESSTFVPHGLWARSMASMLDQIASLGFNVIRVPYTNVLFDPASKPNGFDATKNPDLVGKSGLEVLDALVAGARARRLRILLDRHRPDPSAEAALWYTDAVPESRWIADWTMLAKRYASDPTVIGADLHNEPHGTATWGDGNLTTDWRLAAERAGNAILAVNPGWLIVVEGVEVVGSSSYWWGGNLRSAGASGVRLAMPGQLVYSTHDYPASVSDQPWFHAPTFPANLPGLWDATWGYLTTSGAAPVLVGEFGTKDQSTQDHQWLSSIVTYIRANSLSFAFWSWNPNSGDTGGILADDWQTVNADKLAALSTLLAPLLP
jgi:endoglucanase